MNLLLLVVALVSGAWAFRKVWDVWRTVRDLQDEVFGQSDKPGDGW